jgi:hypothetical protein
MIPMLLLSVSTFWLICRVGLAIEGRLPWRCMRFFEDARAAGALRQSGGVYQFRHRLLQNKLAQEYIEEHKEELGREMYLSDMLAMSRFKAGVYDDADTKIRESLRKYTEAKYHHGIVYTVFLLVDILVDKGDISTAVRELKWLRASKADASMTRHYETQRLLAELLILEGKRQEAKDELAELHCMIERGHRSFASATDTLAARKCAKGLRENPIAFEDDGQNH